MHRVQHSVEYLNPESIVNVVAVVVSTVSLMLSTYQ